VSGLARSAAKVIFGNEGFSKRLEGMAWAHTLAKRFRVREMMNGALARWPIRRNLPSSGVKYNIETFEALSVERTYFGNPVFQQIFSTDAPETFVDLGCNSGIFPVVLAHAAKGRAPRGLCIDANANLVDLARRTIKLNEWTNVHTMCGLVGCTRTDAAETEFFLAPTSLGSSQFDYKDTLSGHPIEWQRVVVPTLEVGTTWTKLFGPDQRCNCLKIDIEGSEMAFLKNEASFLPRVDAILVEWHIWATTRDEITAYIEGHGFRLANTIEDEPRNGVLYFRRKRVS
jgi:FkbM family methyltransferase